MATPKVYVLCDQNCKYEGMTKEQILTAIMQAVSEGTISNIDAGFVSSIKTINGETLRFFVGTQAEYDALSETDKNGLFAIITNDTTKEFIIDKLEELDRYIQNTLENFLNGSLAVGRAENAEIALQAISTSFTKTEFAEATFTPEITRVLVGTGTKLFSGTLSYGGYSSTFTDLINENGRGSIHIAQISETSYVAFVLAVEDSWLKIYNAVINSGKSLFDVAEGLYSNTNISTGCTVTVKHKLIS